MSGSLPSGCVRVIPGDFVGVPTATLNLWLLQAQTALHNLQTGGQPQSLSYSQGDGSRSVTYTPATIENLRSHIAALKQALGLCSGRRPIRPIFA